MSDPQPTNPRRVFLTSQSPEDVADLLSDDLRAISRQDSHVDDAATPDGPDLLSVPCPLRGSVSLIAGSKRPRKGSAFQSRSFASSS